MEDLIRNVFLFISIALFFITIFYRFLLYDYESLYWFLWELKKRKKVSKTKFKKNIPYYRDTLEEYNPVVLRFINDLILENDIDILLILLSLELKGILNINLTEQTITKNNVPENIIKKLSESEKYIYEQVENNATININYNRLKMLIYQDALNYGLIKKDYFNYSDKKIPIIVYIILIIISLVSACLHTLFSNNYYVAISYFFLFMSTLSACILAILLYKRETIPMKMHIHNDLGYSRTKKGEELNIKIEGLKNFLKEHSSLAEKELKQLELWEYYLIYSILFNQNDTALKELKEFTKNIQIFKYYF